MKKVYVFSMLVVVALRFKSYCTIFDVQDFGNDPVGSG